ncbi:DUF4238 domain-containing protein [Priestia megaterium]|uniref:DUF4238 domain-containing protein n=1 Tax=Priestia megaterium TaxID=1404 RepID=UPI0020409BEA|nr:DUF4238 domain-containing protein [Priestia megaterium]MCM3099878.1 DUF4238 domain-containing protein [Priestia megaterium]
MQKKKQQHFVPYFYLLNFANSKNQVVCYDKIKSQIYTNNAISVAKKNYFYDVSKELHEKYDLHKLGFDPQDEQMLEDKFSVMEMEWSATLKTIMDELEAVDNLEGFDFRGSMDNRLVESMSRFLALQSLRTPSYRDLSKTFFETVVETSGKHGEFFKAAKDMEPEVSFLLYIQTGAVERISEMLLDNFNWHIVGHRVTDVPSFVPHAFPTSDNPFIHIEHCNEKGVNSLSDVSLELGIPLSPDYLLLLRDKRYPYQSSDEIGKGFYIKKSVEVYFYVEYLLKSSKRVVFTHDNKMAKALLVKQKQLENMGQNVVNQNTLTFASTKKF